MYSYNHMVAILGVWCRYVKSQSFTRFYSCVFHSLSLCFVLFQFCDVAQVVVIIHPQRGFSEVWL
jgi:hypothetical protein